MSQVVLKDESGGRSFTLCQQHYAPIRISPRKFRRCKKKEKKKEKLTQQMIQRPCRRVYLRRESSNRIKHATVQRQYLNQVQAKSNRTSAERSGGDHLSHLESCCYFHLQGQFSPAAEVVFEATTAIEIKGVAMGSRVGGQRGLEIRLLSFSHAHHFNSGWRGGRRCCLTAKRLWIQS